MRILGIKPGHDGAYALIEDGELVWSLEAEKGSGRRHAPITASLTVAALGMLEGPPDVVAVGGWHGVSEEALAAIDTGYFGLDPAVSSPGRWNGLPVRRVGTTHERSHLLTSLAMAPAAPLADAAVLVWEGVIGSFYRWSDHGARIERLPVLDQPGGRYSALYAIADPSFPAEGAMPNTESAGKLMALAGCADDVEPSTDTRAVVDHLLSRRGIHPFAKRDYRRWACYDAGVEHPELCRAARYLGRRMFAEFEATARTSLPRGLPLVIGGGCGLNCDWNRGWVDTGWFSDVFVPPCTDDTGSAIGAAVGALVDGGGPCRIDWSVYSGAPFDDPDGRGAGWTPGPFDANRVATEIAAGEVVAWVQGRCEIGPRALGHRSLLANAADARSTERLNRIKRREAYRPVAPVCRAAVADQFFDGPVLDPYMLYFSAVREPARLPAITHRDGTARVQALPDGAVPRLESLLDAVGVVTGSPVLCNTSLNFLGRGFINCSADLFSYCEQTGIRHVVIEGTHHVRE